MRNFLRTFRRDEDGASMVEYAVLLTLILAVSAATIQAVGTDIGAIFTAVVGYLAP